jgi:uncharacterized protein (DUF1697 family)
VQTRIVLLRGINLGPRNRISMPELRELLERAGFEEVRTYVQSGNVILRSDASSERVARDCRKLLADALGLDIDVIVRTHDELAEVVRRDPLAKVAVNPKRYQVSFLERELDVSVVDELAALATGAEQLVALGRELYAWHPDGVARSRLWARLASRSLGASATARNWSTVTNLLTIADA